MSARLLPDGPIYISDRLKARFFAKTEEVTINGVKHLLWTAFKDKDGYGRFIWDRKIKNVGSHIVAFIIANGHKPINQCLHKNECHIPSCVLIEHLYDGTAKQNVADAFAIGTAIALSKAWHVNSANWHRGRKRSLETRQKISLGQLGKKRKK